MDAPETKVIPIICGPTGSGKTAAALKLAGLYPVEVVSADSRQLIRHLNIGTDKPDPEQRRAVNFHMLDLIEPGEKYSAYRFIDEAESAIRDILKRKHIPVVVGGTGLYLRALTEGVVEIDGENEDIRTRLEQEMDKVGPEQMHDKLRAVDPVEAGQIHPHNKVRVIRALEIYYLTGVSKSELIRSGAYRKSSRRYKYFCLAPPRDELYLRINDRVERMIVAGLVDEVRLLLDKGLGQAVLKSNVIGYNETIEHLNGNLSLSEMVSSIKQNSRRYAKRQMTWFRRVPECDYFEKAGELVKSAGLLCGLWTKRY